MYKRRGRRPKWPDGVRVGLSSRGVVGRERAIAPAVMPQAAGLHAASCVKLFPIIPTQGRAGRDDGTAIALPPLLPPSPAHLGAGPGGGGAGGGGPGAGRRRARAAGARI